MPSVSHAQIIISEIMYDLAEGSDTGREWVEVFNAGTAPVDLTEWKLFEGTTNHGITALGSATLATGAYAIIADNPAKFLTDWPNVSAVFDSAFSLNNTGETLKMRCCGDEPSDRDSVTYTAEQGGAGDGNSLTRSGSGFVGASPTPGSGSLQGGTHVNESSPSVTETDEGESVSASPTKSSTPSSKQTIEPQITAYAGKDRVVFVGADSVFEGIALNSKKEPIDGVRFVWNFGDGTTAEGESVLHHWKYPGKYMVVLDVAQNKHAVSHRIMVEAVEPELSLSMLNDGGIGIQNASSRDIDLSLWHVKDNGRSFMIPENTFVPKGMTLRVAVSTLGFTASEITELYYPNGVRARGIEEESEPEMLAEGLSIAPTPSHEEAPVLKVEAQAEVAPENATTTPPIGVREAQVAASASVPVDAFPQWVWWLGALCIALVGGASAYFLRPRNKQWVIEESSVTE